MSQGTPSLTTLGVALAAGAAALTTVVWVMGETAKGRGVRVTLVHDVSPSVQDAIAQIEPTVNKLTTEGVRLRLGPGKTQRDRTDEIET